MIIKRLQYIRFYRSLLFLLLLPSFLPAAAEVRPRIALLGDSQTWIGGENCQNETGWSHWLKKSGIADSIDIYARSGATWTNTLNTLADTAFYSEVLHDSNVIYNQARRLAERVKANTTPSPAIVVIFAGANDAWFADRRPGIFEERDSIAEYDSSTPPAEATTLQESVALTCDLLKQSLPGCRIILVSPLEMSKASAEVTAKVAGIIESTANSRGLPTLRADRDIPIRHNEEIVAPRYTYDGVHTNSSGASKVAELISGFILSTENSVSDIKH